MAAGSVPPKDLGGLLDSGTDEDAKKKKVKAKPKAAPKQQESSSSEEESDPKAAPKAKAKSSSSEEESSDGDAKSKVKKELSTTKNKGAGKGTGPREYKGGVDRTKSAGGNDDEDERPNDAKARARLLAQEEAEREASRKNAGNEEAGQVFKPEAKPRSRPKVAKPAALPVPAEDREILTEIFSKYMSRGSARMQALDAASYLQRLQVSEPDRSILVEVLREQSDTGQDSLSKEEFVNWAGNYFQHNDPYENLVEIWRLIGGDRAGGGLVRLRDLQRVIEAWDLKLSREELEEFCGGGDTMNYDRFVHMLAGTDLKA